MIVVTTEGVAGHEVLETIGLVRGCSVRSSALHAEVVARGMEQVGGEILEYTKLLAEVREQALDRMVDEARARGADAVVAVRMVTSEVSRGSAEIIAYGTAVKLTPR